MKNVLLKKIGIIAGLSTLLLAVIGFALETGVKRKVDLRTVYVAAHDIAPRTEIRDTDITVLQLPSAYIQEFVCLSKDEILGKYTDIQGMIPAGSLFYRSMLVDRSELPDNPEAQLRNGQVAYNMEVDMTKLGASMSAGQRVDVYATSEKEDGTLLTDCLLSHARIISVCDHKGISLDDPDSSGTPYLAVLAVNAEDISLLTSAEKRGSVRLYAADDTYDSTLESTRKSDSLVVRYLLNLENGTVLNEKKGEEE